MTNCLLYLAVLFLIGLRLGDSHLVIFIPVFLSFLFVFFDKFLSSLFVINFLFYFSFFSFLYSLVCFMLFSV